MLLDNIAPYSYFGMQSNFRGEHSSNSLAVWVVQAYYVFKHTFWSAKYAPVTLNDEIRSCHCLPRVIFGKKFPSHNMSTPPTPPLLPAA